MMLEKSLVGSDNELKLIENNLIEFYYHGIDPRKTDYGVDDFENNLWRRQARFQTYLLPWINRVMPLRDLSVADIGCGTGSSTAALARSAKNVIGYEISKGSATVARERFNALGIHNASVNVIHPEETIAAIRRDFPEGVHVVSLIAVLEHMTPTERLEFIKESWSVIKEGGLMVIFETPNLLSYFDDHTSKLPFFHMLPIETKIKYCSKSSRAGFNNMSNNTSHEEMYRWGFGISYHDFEIALPVNDINKILVADGFETEPMGCWPPNNEERLLSSYFIDKNICAPLGFSRSVLNLIFRKPWHGVNEFKRNHNSQWILNAITHYKLPNDAVSRLLSGK